MSQYFMGFDTETGGFDPKTTDLLTGYFGIFDDNLRLLEGLYLKLKPDGGRFPVAEAQALKVNKIDIKAHMEDPETVTYSEGKAKLVTLLKKYHKKQGRYNNIRPLGYNVPFDENWVQHHLLPSAEWRELLHYKRVDVMERVDFLKEAKWFPQDLGSLETVVHHLGLPKRAAHNAQEDTLMTIDVYKRLLEIMESKRDGGQSQDLISLLEAE